MNKMQKRLINEFSYKIHKDPLEVYNVVEYFLESVNDKGKRIAKFLNVCPKKTKKLINDILRNNNVNKN